LARAPLLKGLSAHRVWLARHAGRPRFHL